MKKTPQKPAKNAKPTPSKAGLPTKVETKSGASRSLEDALVKQLARILDETALTEIEYEAGGVRVRVARSHTAGIALAPVAQAPAAAVSAVAAPPAPAAPVDPASHPGTVKSPMVGVCYLLPEPGAAAFVMLGDSIAEGQTLCLIEAMKTFNPVKAQRAGKIFKIIVENGAPVEYGEPLLIID